MEVMERTYVEQVGYNTERGSDKEYRINVVALPDGKYGLRCYNGPRGRATSKAQWIDFDTFDEAVTRAEKFKKEKTKGHYVFGDGDPNGTPVASSYDRIDTGLRPQLLNAIDREAANKLMTDPAWVLQRKYNGENLLIRVAANGAVTYATKDGYVTTVPKVIDTAVQAFGEGFLCGEILGDRVAIFDILEHDGVDFRKVEYGTRAAIYTKLLQGNETLFAVQTARTNQEKIDLREQIEAEDGEGECWKRSDSLYEPGKPSKGGPHLKCKAWRSANFIVVAHNEKNSVRLGVSDSGNITEVGNVTIHGIYPEINSVIEVRYLDYFPGGAVTQTTLLHNIAGARAEDCPISQLRSLARDR